jgi:murein DD-endopeptidase MepM/ murein hydrolase activator NlpD
MGNTGLATGVHVHYEVVRDGDPVNPRRFILPSGLVVD